MRLLLDTHALLWWLADDGSLVGAASAAMADPQADVFVSAASVWEVAIKQATGRLMVSDRFRSALAESGFIQLGITFEHALAAGALPRLHNDPFDRVLVAQALAEELTLVTRDPRLAAYGVPVLVA